MNGWEWRARYEMQMRRRRWSAACPRKLVTLRGRTVHKCGEAVEKVDLPSTPLWSANPLK
jgi:hypothetical protein